MSYHYVYILESLKDPSRHYTGSTQNVRRRLDAHNNGLVSSSAPYGPWKLGTVHIFRDKYRALAFERYLKSGSGREFARRHF